MVEQTVNNFCERCGFVTPHKVEGSHPVTVFPSISEGQKIDLTGRRDIQTRNVGMSFSFMNEMRSLQCIRCGNRTVNAGCAPQAGDDDFSRLMRGEDWKPPIEPKE